MRKFEKVYFYKLSAWNSPMDSIYAKPWFFKWNGTNFGEKLFFVKVGFYKE